ncbi:DUF3376 domain-containing protein [Leucobacter sp.]
MSGASSSTDGQHCADEAERCTFHFPDPVAGASAEPDAAASGADAVTDAPALTAPADAAPGAGTSGIGERVAVRVFPVPRTADGHEMRRAWDDALACAARWTGPGIGPRQPADLRGRTLKLALAMRGGVSLAVWIGGAVAELDLLRALRVFRGRDRVAVVLAWDADSAPPAPVVERAARYGLLLARRDYHRVVLDVLAGASAGGLNSVLLAVAQRAGRSVEQALETWRTAGGFHELLRHEGLGPVESLLRGDEYFAAKVLEQLEKFFAEPRTGDDPVPMPPHPGLQVDEVSIDLSATVVNAQDARHPDIRLGRAGFRFATGVADADIPGSGVPDARDADARDTDARSAGSENPADGAPDGAPNDDPAEESRRLERTAALRRLALAARTTSSFPGAFEPSTVWSFAPVPGDGPKEEIPEQALLTGEQARVIDMSAAFLQHRASGSAGPFRVVDGGVFDNIPIERAYRAIGMRGSRVPVRRALFYLDPTPPPPPDPPKRRAERLGDLTSVLLRLLSAKRSENAREDRAELERSLLQHWVREGRYELLATMPVEATAPAAQDEQLRAYARSRASRDHALIISVLADTEAWQLGNDVRPRRTWTEDPDRAADWVDRMDLGARVNRLTDAGNGEEDLARVARDPVAARETALWMLECVQWLELVLRVAAPEAPGAVPFIRDRREQREDLRGRLYDALQAGERMMEARLLAVADAYSGTPGQTGAEGADQGPSRDPSLVREEVWWPASPEDGLGALWAMLEGCFRDLVELLPASPAPTAPSDPATDDSRDEASRDDDSRDEIPMSGAVPPGPGRSEAIDADEYPAEHWWAESPWKLLPPLAAAGPATGVRRIAPLFSVIGEPSSRDAPYFATLDGRWRWDPPAADGSPLRESLGRLREVHVEMVAQRIVRDREGEEYASRLAGELGGRFRLPPEAKLAGSLFIMNFGGFLSSDWRTGDWWWGRIDAAATLTEELSSTADADGDARLHPSALAELVAQQLRHEAGGSAKPSEDADDVGAATGAHSPVELLTGRQGGLGRLSGSYLTATAHRSLRVASRSLIGARFPLKAPLAALVHLLAPVLVFLPGVAQVPRLAAAGALAVAGLALARAGAADGRAAGCVDAVSDGAPLPLCAFRPEAVWAADPSRLMLLVIALALLAALLAGAVRASQRWRKLEVILPTALPERTRGEMARRAAVRTLIPVAAMAGALLGARLADEAGDGAMATLWAVVGVALLPVALASMLRVRDRAPAGARKDSAAFGVIAAAAAVVAIAAPIVAPAVRSLIAGGLRSPESLAVAAHALLIGWVVLGLLAAGAALTAGVVGKAGSVWIPLLAAAAAAAVLLVPPVRIGELSLIAETACCGLEAGLPWWRWALAVLAWGNVLWFLPAWLRLETRAWSDDSLWEPVEPGAATAAPSGAS